jgi:hypothetical protein
MPRSVLSRHLGPKICEIAVTIALMVAASGCCSYDKELAEQLVVVKTQLIGGPVSEGQPAQTGLYDHLSDQQMPANVDQAKSEVSKLVKIAETNKQPFCDEPAAQALLIEDKFRRDLDARAERPLTTRSAQARKENMEELIDTAIRTQDRLNKKP